MSTMTLAVHTSNPVHTAVKDLERQLAAAERRLEFAHERAEQARRRRLEERLRVMRELTR